MRPGLAAGIVLTLFLPWILNAICHISVSASSSVQNIDTGLIYSAIQQAIDAPETLDGHTIVVASGIYHENVVVNKKLSLVGEDRSTTIIDGNGGGIVVYITADNVVFSNFTVQNGSYGIRLYHSENSTISRNNVYNMQWFSVELNYSGNSTLRDNSVVGDRFNFGVEGASLPDFVNNIDTSNTINGKPIHYLINQHDLKIDSSTFPEIGFLALVNSTNISVEDMNLTHNKEGLLFAYVTNSFIRNVDVIDNWNGIYVKNSLNITVKRNNANNNFDYAIALRSSENCVVSENNANNNTWGGISIGSSWNTTVSGNNANNNYYGIHLDYCRNATIRGNNANNNRGYSVVVYYLGNNTFYHNNFDNSLTYAQVESCNIWDNGLEGNYWSSYTGTDVDHDGIGDAPYVIDENNLDNYPLAGKFFEFNVAWEEEDYCITAISNSAISEFQLDQLNKTISFNVAGENGTAGFCRIAIPNILVQDSWNGDFTVLIYGQQRSGQMSPTKNWADDRYTYLYLAYVHGASRAIAIPEPWVILAILSLSAVIVIAVVFWKRKTHSQSEKS